MIDGAQAATETTTGTATAWGVAFLKPNGIGAARSDLLEAGLRVFYPRILTLEVSRRLRRRVLLREPIVKPLFPGYAFVGWARGSEDWAPVGHARGVVDLIRTCGKLSPPALVPARVMAAMLAAGELLDLTGSQRQSDEETFEVGETVRVDRRGFEDQVFRIARLDPKRRIRFILHSLKPGFESFELKASAKDLKRVAA